MAYISCFGSIPWLDLSQIKPFSDNMKLFKVLKFVDDFFQQFFKIFALHSVKSSKILDGLLSFINFLFQLTIFSIFLINGGLLFSTDALSQMTDITEMLIPVLAYFTNIVVFFKNRSLCIELTELREYLDEKLQSYDEKLFEKIYCKKFLIFIVKTVIIVGIGTGLECFLIIS